MTTTATHSNPMPAATGGGLLRVALKLDAAVTGANGLAYVALAGPLGDLFDVPPSFLRAIGAFLVVFAALVWIVGSESRIDLRAAAAVAAANAAWVVASVVMLIAGWHDPSTVGAVWTALQAAVVAGFAALQVAGCQQAR
jgi:hypothetical protein